MNRKDFQSKLISDAITDRNAKPWTVSASQRRAALISVLVGLYGVDSDAPDLITANALVESIGDAITQIDQRAFEFAFMQNDYAEIGRLVVEAIYSENRGHVDDAIEDHVAQMSFEFDDDMRRCGGSFVGVHV